MCAEMLMLIPGSLHSQTVKDCKPMGTNMMCYMASTPAWAIGLRVSTATPEPTRIADTHIEAFLTETSITLVVDSRASNEVRPAICIRAAEPQKPTIRFGILSTGPNLHQTILV